jgi:hypothetical protein
MQAEKFYVDSPTYVEDKMKSNKHFKFDEEDIDDE